MGYAQITFQIARLSKTVWNSRIVILCLAFVVLATVNLVGPFDKIVFADEGDYIAIAKTLITDGVYGYPPGQACHRVPRRVPVHLPPNLRLRHLGRPDMCFLLHPNWRWVFKNEE